MKHLLAALMLCTFAAPTFASDVTMNSLVKKYNNLIHTDRIEREGDSNIILNVSYESLPKSVKNKLEKLEINVMKDWDLVIPRDSEYVVNESLNDLYQHDIYKVVVDNKTLGYIFNITTCNIEECYGWDALYLGQRGGLIYKSF